MVIRIVTDSTADLDPGLAAANGITVVPLSVIFGDEELLDGVDIDSQGFQQQEASRALIDRKIDAFFYTVGNPAAAIEEPANSTDIKIVPLDTDAIKSFVAERPYYVMTTIQAGTYKGVTDAVNTYAVTATVVTSANVADDLVYDVVKTVFENLAELQGAHAAFRHLDPQAMLQGLSAPLHPGAERYYKEQGWL